VAKKADNALKSLKKDVAKLRKQNDKLAKALQETREDQAAAHRELRSFIEQTLTAQDAGSGEQAESHSRNGEEKSEVVTEAAERRAGELGVDLSSVKGTGSGGRVLVKDVEAAADAK
jgi:pyruvate/2-oxoglutarate dehydrogenase complex dihydrolipoamide acyltransferase (E2) component